MEPAKMSRQTISKTRIVRLLERAALENVSFEVCGRGLDWSIECADRRTSILVKRALRLAGVRTGGYLAGWGGWVWDNVDRSSYAYTCDFNDRASIHHY
jgi:hypothetical protein